MSVTRITVEGIDVIVGDYADIDAAMSAGQMADVEALALDKRRRERALTYTLINHASLTDDKYRQCYGAVLAHRSDGAPFFQSASGVDGIAISLSHCRSGACMALDDSGKMIGIDMEDFSSKITRVQSKFVSESELELLTALPIALESALLVVWTIKEAVYKAAGVEGLSLRDGISIKKITMPSAVATPFNILTEATSATPNNLLAEVTVAGLDFRCFTHLTPARSLTLAVAP